MNKTDSGIAASVWGLWLAVVIGGCVIASIMQSSGEAYTKLRQIEDRVTAIEKKTALIDALTADTGSPYRQYYEAMQELRRRQNERPQGSDRSTAAQSIKVEQRLDELEIRLTELDGKSRPGRMAYPYFGRGRSGLVGRLEDRIESLEGDVESLDRDVRGLDFDLNYRR